MPAINNLTRYKPFPPPHRWFATACTVSIAGMVLWHSVCNATSGLAAAMSAKVGCYGIAFVTLHQGTCLLCVDGFFWSIGYHPLGLVVNGFIVRAFISVHQSHLYHPCANCLHPAVCYSKDSSLAYWNDRDLQLTAYALKCQLSIIQADFSLRVGITLNWLSCLSRTPLGANCTLTVVKENS